MSSIDGKTARRYARALFELIDPSALEDTQTALEQFADVWQENSSLQRALLNPGTPNAEKLLVIGDISESLRPGDQKLKNFLSLLLTNRRVSGVTQISEQFSQLIDELRNRLAMQITSAFPVSETEQSEVQGSVQAKFGSLASIAWKVDPELIGGLRINVGDRVLDSSVLGGLNRARSALVA